MFLLHLQSLLPSPSPPSPLTFLLPAQDTLRGYSGLSGGTRTISAAQDPQSRLASLSPRAAMYARFQGLGWGHLEGPFLSPNGGTERLRHVPKVTQRGRARKEALIITCPCAVSRFMFTEALRSRKSRGNCG